MRRTAWIAVGVLLLGGCASPPRGAVLWSSSPAATAQVARVPNLALGPTPEHGFLAELFNYRSSWPSVQTGYRLGETSYFTEFIYDDQSFFDRAGGGFQQARESYRSGTLIR